MEPNIAAEKNYIDNKILRFCIKLHKRSQIKITINNRAIHSLSNINKSRRKKKRRILSNSYLNPVLFFTTPNVTKHVIMSHIKKSHSYFYKWLLSYSCIGLTYYQPVTSLSALPMSARLFTVLTPASSSAANLSSAVPLPPEIMAPAWPIRLPGGAVTPAI